MDMYNTKNVIARVQPSFSGKSHDLVRHSQIGK